MWVVINGPTLPKPFADRFPSGFHVFFRDGSSLPSACPLVDIPTGCGAVMRNVKIFPRKMTKKRSFGKINPRRG